ncbi:MAG: fused MFS/spermidine synthase [Syntrophaceae bacterium]|nr:fused MFS/spermidine synthase [Syntrophaceae bacterium]
MKTSRFPCRLFGITFFLLLLLGTPQKVPAGNEQTLYEGDSIYNHITIRQAGLNRCMIFGRHRDQRQTCMNIPRPDESVFEYTAMMFVGFQFLPDTRSVCLIGLGGGYIPTVFRMHLPQVRLQSVEVDPLVVRLAKDYFHFQLAAGHALSVTDGRQYLRRNPGKFDQIWIDAFNSDYIPAHMTTKEFLELCLSRLTQNGVVVQNVHNSNQLFDAQVTTFRSVFRHVYVFEGTNSSNSIIVATRAPLYPPPRLCGERCRSRIGPIDLIRESRKFDPNPRIRKEKILTDDYNPANLLLNRR